MRYALLGLCLCSAVLTAQSPFPGGVWLNDGWVPCSHPIAVNAGVGCVETPAPTVPQTFQARAGATYEHRQAGWRLYLVGPVQRANGSIVTLAEVVVGRDYLGRELFEVGSFIEVTGTFRTAEWREVK
jgi:hypothetical protein